MIRLMTIPLLGLWVGLGTVSEGYGAVGQPLGNPHEDESRFKSMPWHLVDLWWNFKEPTPFERLEVEVTIDTDVPEPVPLYIAPIGLGHLGETPFYGGIQTQSDGYTRENPRLRKIGPGLLFSRWEERRVEAVRPAEGGLFQSSGHEGDFVSVRRPYRWTKGTYTYRLVKMERDDLGDEVFTWVGAFLESHERHETIFIGALRFPGDKLTLKPAVANFVEIYGPRIPVSRIPRVTVTFGPPIVNGKRPEQVSAEAIYPKGVPDYAEARAVDGRVVVEVGKPVETRPQRQVRLID